ncbi:MAG: tetratricopeptide repeat protein [Hyphomicrobiaceae bacterium]
MRARVGQLALALGVGLSVGAGGAAGPGRAETSSWEQRIVPAPHVKAKPKGGTAVKSRTIDPAQAPKGALSKDASGAVPKKASLGPMTTSVMDDADAARPGSDAAYEAFDQGKYLTALSIAAKQAKQGDAIAHTLVARIHAEGLGVPQNAKLAAQWYARGAELGDPEAALGLGTLYARGEGVAQDYGKAAEFFEKAAAKGHAEAAYNLALLFLAGKGKPELPRRGFMLMEYAADKGVIAAMYDLGTLYATGTGTPANAFEAAKWIGKAANQGYPEAEVEYAVILMKNHQLPADQLAKMRHRAVELLRSASRKGLVVAQNRLAHCYFDGLGTAKNTIEAAKWHLIAKAGGHGDAALDKAVAALSATDRRTATVAAAEWRDRMLLE